LLGANLQRLSLFYTATGAVLNVAFNLVLIPLLGIRGAALATLIAQFSPNFIQLFIAEARPNFFMMMRSFTAPLRLLQAALR
jgi:Na+-driven multidrug efflux pump